MSKDKEKARAQTRERVRRYRQKHKDETVTDTNVTPVTVKMICKCQYYKLCNGQLICAQCSKPAPPRTVEDKLKRGIHIK